MHRMCPISTSLAPHSKWCFTIAISFQHVDIILVIGFIIVW